MAPSASAVNFQACKVTDTAGIDDKSFNANAWKGLQDAQAKLGVQIKYLSRLRADYEKNINTFLTEGCNIIVTAGFLLGDATKAAAEANPKPGSRSSTSPTTRRPQHRGPYLLHQ